MTTTPALEVSGLGVSYGAVKALDNIDVVVEPRTVVGVIGPNGAGKTTLVDATSGFVSHAVGTVSLGGRRVEHLTPHQRARAGLRRTFQQSRAAEDLTVERYVRFCARQSLTDSDFGRLLELAGDPPRTVALGELDVPSRRLVEFVGAVAAGPSVLMLDEPAAGLGESESADLGDRISELPGEYGISVLVIEHDMQLVRKVCASVVVLDFGERIAAGPPSEVLATEAVRLAYLGMEA